MSSRSFFSFTFYKCTNYFSSHYLCLLLPITFSIHAIPKHPSTVYRIISGDCIIWASNSRILTTDERNICALNSMDQKNCWKRDQIRKCKQKGAQERWQQLTNHRRRRVRNLISKWTRLSTRIHPAISNVLCWIITEAFEITDLSNNSDVYKVAITGGGDR